MPLLVADFAEAVCQSPDDQAWLRLFGQALIDFLIEPDAGSAAMVLGDGSRRAHSERGAPGRGVRAGGSGVTRCAEAPFMKGPCLR